MKKILTIVSLILLVILTGCFGGDNSNNKLDTVDTTNSPEEVIADFEKGIEDNNSTLIEENLVDNIKLSEIRKKYYYITSETEYRIISEYRTDGLTYQGEEWYKDYENEVNQYYVNVVEQESPPYIKEGDFEVLSNDETNQELSIKTTITYYSIWKDWFVKNLSYTSVGSHASESRYFLVEITTSEKADNTATFIGQFEEGDNENDYYGKGSIKIKLLIENNKWIIDEIIKSYEIEEY
jgi:hypothetical protein